MVDDGLANTQSSDAVVLDAGPVQRLHAAIAGGAVATAWALATPAFTGSLALGALLEAVNFRSLRRNSEATFNNAWNGSAIAAAGFGLRFSLLLAAIAGSLWAGAHPVGLVIGLSLIVPSTLLSAWLARPQVVEAAPLDEEEAAWEAWNPWFARENDIEDEDEA